MLEIKNYSKTYDGKVLAVDKLNLTVKNGQIMAFIGHNGAGKTTTLKSICGILPFESGEILVNGISVKEQPMEVKKQLAYLPDNPDMYDHLKGIAYLNFVADSFKVSEADRMERITKYAKLFKIENNLNDIIETYSHGMKQKLAIISVLVHAPKLILLDEPFVGLDPQSTHDFKEIMKDLTKQGCAILYSTHVLEVAEKLATHVAIIHKGKLIKHGTIKQVIGDESLEEMFLGLAHDE